MMNFFMLLVAAASTSSVGASTHAPLRPQAVQRTIAVHSPKDEPGGLRICDDGRVLVYPAGRPKSPI